MTGGHSAPRVAIVGGGPAGATAAVTLARLGLRPVLFEAAPEPQGKVGECLPPTCRTVLERLGLAAELLDSAHVRSYGNRSCWGEEQPRERDFLLGVHGHGWHLDRRRFEEALARLAVESGVDWRYGSTVRSVCRQDRGWEILVATRHGVRAYQADAQLDASGRRASVARRLGARRVSYDRLVGLAMQLEPAGRGATDTFTLVESIPSGWWYSALLAGGRLVVAYLTDHDLPEFRLARRPDGWWDLLRQTHLSWSRVREHGYRPGTPLRILPAQSARLTVIVGHRWLAVGDAAAAYDPLSSHGITTAMGSGYYGARAVADLLHGQGEAGPAYLSLMQTAYATYLQEQRACYAAERRWSGHPFWSRRQTGAAFES